VSHLGEGKYKTRGWVYILQFLLPAVQAEVSLTSEKKRGSSLVQPSVTSVEQEKRLFPAVFLIRDILVRILIRIRILGSVHLIYRSRS
jgi:hypothetical protein